jgi:hypothetical protein
MPKQIKVLCFFLSRKTRRGAEKRPAAERRRDPPRSGEKTRRGAEKRKTLPSFLKKRSKKLLSVWFVA